MEVAGGSTAELARTGILIENVGIDAARAELLGLADTADAVGKRAGQSASAGANLFARSFVEAARQARTALQTELATNAAGIQEALARDLITQDQARAAGHDAAIAYKQGLLAAIDQGEKIGAFKGDTGEAAYRQLAEALKVATDAEARFAAETRSLLGAEQAAHAEEERRQAALRGLVAAEQAAYTEEQRRTAAVRQSIAVEESAYAAEERRQAALRSLAAAEQAAYAEDQRRSNAVRQMAIIQAEAIAMDERRTASLAAAAAASNTAARSLQATGDGAARGAVNLNTLRGSATALVANLLQAAPGVTQFGSAISSLALGTGVTLGVLGAVAAISGAYRLLTEDERKAKEEQDRLTASLGKWYDAQRDGASGELQRQIGAELRAIRELKAELAGESATSNIKTNLSVGLGTLLSTATSFNPATIGDEFARRWAEVVARQKAAIQKGAAEVAAAGREAYEREIRATMEFFSTESSNLSSLISSGTATGAEVTDAVRNLDQYRRSLTELQNQYAGLNDAKRRAFNLEQQTSAANNIKTIEDALRSAILRPLQDIEREQKLVIDGLNAYVAAHSQALDAIGRGGDQLRTGATRNADDLRASDQAATLARTEGSAREYLANQYKAENAAIEANRTLMGIALRERLETIEAVRRQGNETIRLTELQKQLGDAAAKAAQNEASTRRQLAEQLAEGQAATRATAGLIEALARDVHQALARGIRDGLHDGVGAGLAELLQTAVSTAGRLAPEIGRKLFSHDMVQYDPATGGLLRTSQPGLSAHDTEQLGYFAIAADAVQGFASALNTLTGAVNKTAQQLDNEVRSRLSARQSLENYQRSTLGSPIEQQLASNRDAAQQQRDQIESAFGGRRFEQERNRLLAEVASVEAAKAAQIAQDFFDGIAAGLRSLQGPAGALENQLAALRKQYEDNIAAAQALGGSTEDVTKLYLAQREQLERAAREAEQRRSEDLDVRRITALGGTSRQIDDARFVFGQRREVEETRVAYGEGSPELEQIRAIQKLEEDRRAADFAALQEQAREDYRVRALQAEGRSAEAAALRLQLEQQREYQAAVKAGLDDATLAALALAQAAEGAAAAAKQAQDAQRALDDLQVRKLTAQGDTSGADALRFQLQQQRELEDAIAAGRTQEYLDRLKEVQRLEAEARNAGAQTVNNTAVARDVRASEAVSYAARNLSEITGNRMADYLGTQTTYQRDIRDDVRRIAAGGIPSFAQPIGYSAATQPGPGPIGDIAAALAARSTGVPAPTTSGGARDINLRLTIDVRASRAGVRATASDDEIDSLVDRIKGRLIDAIAKDAALQRLADGSPLVSG